mgnify:CR=1 FL=1
MITQLHTPIGCYIPSLETEGYTHFIRDAGLEDYFYFIILTDKGEWWELKNQDVRGTFNITAGRKNK